MANRGAMLWRSVASDSSLLDLRIDLTIVAVRLGLPRPRPAPTAVVSLCRTESYCPSATCSLPCCRIAIALDCRTTPLTKDVRPYVQSHRTFSPSCCFRGVSLSYTRCPR